MKINVIGLGPGNIKYISAAGIECIKEAEILVGSARQLSDLKSIISEEQEIYILGKLGELVTYLKENIGKKITVIVSGDTGYYSLVPYLSKNLSKCILNIICKQYQSCKVLIIYIFNIIKFPAMYTCQPEILPVFSQSGK